MRVGDAIVDYEFLRTDDDEIDRTAFLAIRLTKTEHRVYDGRDDVAPRGLGIVGFGHAPESWYKRRCRATPQEACRRYLKEHRRGFNVLAVKPDMRRAYYPKRMVNHRAS
jgi:hypothetical protein